LIRRIFKKRRKKKPEPVKANPPAWDVPLDQTTSEWRKEGEELRP
jgi:hypothetical protein